MTSTKTFEKAAFGFNHNVTHRGRVYHVQTEDSGVSKPQVITHLFVGGTILATKKSSYAHLTNEPDLYARVRALMEAQHKEMLRDLVNDAYEARSPDAPTYQPGELVDGPLPTAPMPLQLSDIVPTSASSPRAAPTPSAPSFAAPTPAVPPTLSYAPQTGSALQTGAGRFQGTSSSFGAVGAAGQPPSAPSVPSDLGRFRPPPSKFGAQGQVPRPPPSAAPPPPVADRSAEGQDDWSEKSLDEVILAYLASHPKNKP
jgi:hypothetical protein